MSTNFIKKLVALVVCIPLIVLLISCEEYQEEDFTIADMDARACELFEDTVSVKIPRFPLVSFDSTWVDSAVYENVLEILDSLEANEIIVTDSDTSFTITTAENVEMYYICFFTELNEVVIFSNYFTDMNIIDADGTVINKESSVISLETVAGCSEIRTRNVYNLSERKNLLQIVKIESDQTGGKPFLLVILPSH